jgi:uncharacterized protein (DUF342 family)
MAYHKKTSPVSCTSPQEIEKKIKSFLDATTTDVDLGYTPPTPQLSHRIATVDHICTRSCGSRREGSLEALETAVGLHLRIALSLQFRSKLQEQLALTQEQLALTREQLISTQEQQASTKEQLASTQEQLASTQEQLASTQEQLASTQEQLALTQEQLASTQEQLALTQEQLVRTEGRLQALYQIRSEWQDTIKKIQSRYQTMLIQEGNLSLRLVDPVFAKVTELTDKLFQNGE